MKLSNRISTLTGDGDDGWALLYRARALKAAGTEIIDLTIGEHDIRTDPSILAAMNESAKGGHTGYASVPGTKPLRDAVAARVSARTGVPTTRDNVLITPGGQSALFAAHHACCDEGDTAAYIEPYYATYPGTIRTVGAIPRAVPVQADNGFQPTATDLAAARGARSLLINTPNNPTGVIYNRQTIETIAQTVIENDMWLISDEVYDTQIWRGEHLSPRAIDGMAARTLVVGSMSKSHAMTGSRIGWVIADAPVIEHLRDLATHTTYGVAGFIQDAAHFALTDDPELERRVGAPFERRRKIAMDILDTQNTVRLIPSDGAMYLMLDIRGTGLSGDSFANTLLDHHNIAVMPGESFGQAAAGHIRVAMTVDDDALAEALRTLCAFSEDLLPEQ